MPRVRTGIQALSSEHRKIVMKSKILILMVAAILLAACGKETIVVQEVTPTVTVAPTVTAAPVVANKYDLYLDAVRNSAGKAYGAAPSGLIRTGDLICERLDEGISIEALDSAATEASDDDQDLDLFTSALYYAIEFLCPEYIPTRTFYLRG